ncbi:hypothetical protein BGZ65_003721, partial [Modicella reniformis]
MAARAPSTFYVLTTLFAFLQIVSHLWPKHHPRSSAGFTAHFLKRAEPDLELQCENVWDHSDHCAYVKEYCADYSSGLINYLHIYFCDMNTINALVLVLMGLWMVFLFALVGITASDFFCPNLNTIAKKLHLSESMTGVTFLAFGNASPDIFSTFSAISAGSSTLAVGEVIGATSFIITVVIGSMAIVTPFKVSRAPFLRDITFLTGCTLFMLFMVVTRKITLVESVLLIVAYITYVAVVVFGNWRHSTVPQPQAASEDDPFDALEDQDNTEDHDEETGDPKTPQEQAHGDRDALYEADTQRVALSADGSTSASFDPSYSPYSSIRQCPTIIINAAYSISNLNISPGRRKEYITVNSGDSNHENNLQESSVDDDLYHDHGYTQIQQALLYHSLILPDRSDPSNKPRSPLFQDPPGGFFQDTIPTTCFWQRVSLVFKDWIKPVYFPSLLGWDEKSWILKILAVGSIPIVLILTLTLPVVDLPEDEPEVNDIVVHVQHAQDEEPMFKDTTTSSQNEQVSHYNGWCQIQTVIQMVLAPVFITTVVTNASGESSLAILVAVGVGMTMGIIVFHNSTEETPPRFYEGLAFFGFLVAMTWIFVVANEVVGILQALGMILGISDAILGLTVFAM